MPKLYRFAVWVDTEGHLFFCPSSATEPPRSLPIAVLHGMLAAAVVSGTIEISLDPPQSMTDLFAPLPRMAQFAASLLGGRTPITSPLPSRIVRASFDDAGDWLRSRPRAVTGLLFEWDDADEEPSAEVLTFTFGPEPITDIFDAILGSEEWVEPDPWCALVIATLRASGALSRPQKHNLH